MSRSEWSREIEALTPFVEGTAIELSGPLTGLISGTVPVRGAHGMHDWGHLVDGSANAIVALAAPSLMADPVEPPDPLLQQIRVQRHVEQHETVRELEIATLAADL